MNSVVSRKRCWCPERWPRWPQLLHKPRTLERNLAGTLNTYRSEFWPLISARRMNYSFLTSSVGSHGPWVLAQQKPRILRPTWVNLRARALRRFQIHRGSLPPSRLIQSLTINREVTPTPQHRPRQRHRDIPQRRF